MRVNPVPGQFTAFDVPRGTLRLGMPLPLCSRCNNRRVQKYSGMGPRPRLCLQCASAAKHPAVARVDRIRKKLEITLSDEARAKLEKLADGGPRSAVIERLIMEAKS